MGISENFSFHKGESILQCSLLCTSMYIYLLVNMFVHTTHMYISSHIPCINIIFQVLKKLHLTLLKLFIFQILLLFTCFKINTRFFWFYTVLPTDYKYKIWTESKEQLMNPVKQKTDRKSKKT